MKFCMTTEPIHTSRLIDTFYSHSETYNCSSASTQDWITNNLQLLPFFKLSLRRTSTYLATLILTQPQCPALHSSHILTWFHLWAHSQSPTNTQDSKTWQLTPSFYSELSLKQTSNSLAAYNLTRPQAVPNALLLQASHSAFNTLNLHCLPWPPTLRALWLSSTLTTWLFCSLS